MQDWKEENDFLVKRFKFSNFQQAFAFMTRVAFLAEQANHHPDWSNVYDQVTIKLRTHERNAITHKDYELASAINAI